METNELKSRIIELVREKKYLEAYQVISDALSIYPTNLFFLSNEIFILFKLNKTREAREKAEQRLATLKNDPFFLRTYIAILERQNAREDIRSIIENSVSHMHISNINFYIYMSKVALRVFDRDKAKEVIQRVSLFFPEDEDLKKLINDFDKEGSIGSKYKYYMEKFKDKRVKDAILEIENIKSLPAYQNDYGLHLCLAELYKKDNLHDRAIDTYKYLLSVKDSEFVRKMLGYIYYKSGDYENALAYLKDIFIKDPNDRYICSTIFKIFKEKNDYTGYEQLITETVSSVPEAKHLFGFLKRADKWKKD